MLDSVDYGDRVRIETHIESLRSRAVQFAYRTFSGDKLIAVGTTRHVAVDGNLRPRRMPDRLIEALRDYVEARNEAQNP